MAPWFVMCLSAMCVGQVPSSDQSSAPPSNERQADVAKLAQRVTQSHRFALQDADTPLTLQPQPVLRWSNPTAGEVYGDVFVWTDRGRPALVGSIFRWFQPDWGATLELCLLSPETMNGSADDRVFWHPSMSGLTWQPLVDVPAPASAAGRLSLMKRIAAEFSASLSDGRNAKTAPVPRVLRLMPQPLFRYPAPESESGYVDGALFAFVESTDPEVLLMIEAVRDGSPTPWRFGLARMNNFEIRVSHRDKQVWQVPATNWQKMRKDPHVPYIQFVVDVESGRAKT